MKLAYLVRPFYIIDHINIEWSVDLKQSFEQLKLLTREEWGDEFFYHSELIISANILQRFLKLVLTCFKCNTSIRGNRAIVKLETWLSSKGTQKCDGASYKLMSIANIRADVAVLVRCGRGFQGESRMLSLHSVLLSAIFNISNTHKLSKIIPWATR